VSGARLRRGALALAAAAVLLLLLPLPSRAAETWQATPAFMIDTNQVPGYPAGGESVRYRIFDSLGNPIGPVFVATAAKPREAVEVPPVPGAYKLESWVLDADGNELTRVSTILRFDDVAPSAPGAAAPGGWLRGEEVALLDLQAPAAPLPLSGLGGYAISLDRGTAVHPCAGPAACTEEEIDLAAGASLEQIPLGTLPQGTTYARVVAVSRAGVPSPVSTATFRVDSTAPSVSLSGIPDGWRNQPVTVHAHATDTLSGMAAAGPGGPITAISVDRGAATQGLGDTASVLVSGSGVHGIDASARDAAGNVGGDPAASEPPAAIVRIDEGPPQVTFARSQDPAEPERIEAMVADRLSGPSASAGSISVRLAGTRDRYEQLPTRVAAGRLVAHWNSDSYPPGKYEFLATGFDVAGNSAPGTDRDRGGRMVLVNPLKTPVWLTTKVSEGRFSGRLRRVGGGGLTGQRVAIVETFAAGAEPRRRTTLRTTDADGSFSLRLAPGPSREVVALFAGSPTLTRGSGPTARLGVATGLRFSASAATAAVGGKPVVFSGSVGSRGARQAVRGLPVELQFRYPGAGWRSFRTVEADRRGRFRYGYRFSDDDSRGVRFQFRAHVKGRKGWPYGPGTSRPVSVTGR
jgi:hypothetical protein